MMACAAVLGGDVAFAGLFDDVRTADEKCDAEVAAIRTVDELKAKQSAWRRAWLDGIGGLPDVKTPLNAQEGPVAQCDGGVVFRDCENVVPEGGGRVVTRIIEGTDHFVPCDTLITAISEKPAEALLAKARALPEKVYLAGDFLTGPRTVVEAVASAREAVAAITANLSAK